MSKLSIGYPVADPKRFIRFAHLWQTDLDPVFLGRLAALARDKNTTINILSGFRTYEEQVKSYIGTGGYQDKNGIWVGGNGYAAVPGRSWHEYGEGADVSDSWLKDLEKDEPTKLQKTLLKYGLFKPLTKGNKKTVLEDWHIQPIETEGVVDAALKKGFLLAYKAENPTNAIKYLTVMSRVSNPELWFKKVSNDTNIGWLFIKWARDVRELEKEPIRLP